MNNLNQWPSGSVSVRCVPITQEVTGSNPVSPTIASALNFEHEQLPLRELLEALLGTEGRRRLALRHKTNEERFTLYDSELISRICNARNLDNERRLHDLRHTSRYRGNAKQSNQLPVDKVIFLC